MKLTAASRHALSAVYREHHDFVWRSLRCLGVTDAAVDDAVQDVFIVVHRRLEEFEGRSTLRTWLYQIARRVAWRYRQRASTDAARNFELPELEGGPDLDDAVARAEALEILRAFIRELDEDKAAVFVLTEFGGLQGHEIARSLDVNVNTVHARLRAARMKLDRMVRRLAAREAGPVMNARQLAPAVARERPRPGQRRRIWASLVVALDLAPVATPWLASVPTPAVVAAVVVPVVAVVVGLSLGSSPEPAEPTPTSEPRAAVVAASSSPTKGMASSPEVPPTLAAVDPPAARAPSASTAHVPTGREKRSAEAPVPGLQRELELVRAMRDALHQRRPRRALELASQHQTRFSAGTLGSEVAALRIDALCDAGRVDDANRAATRFARDWPGSSLEPGPSPCERIVPRPSKPSR
ncbi:MAG: sigma-70 family RNA polymerase sigma factor [Myxococcota bacterium]